MAGKCPKCGTQMKEVGIVRCLCDKDFCEGQRCGANELHAKDECPNCGYTEIPVETQDYYHRYLENEK